MIFEFLIIFLIYIALLKLFLKYLKDIEMDMEKESD